MQLQVRSCICLNHCVCSLNDVAPIRIESTQVSVQSFLLYVIFPRLLLISFFIIISFYNLILSDLLFIAECASYTIHNKTNVHANTLSKPTTLGLTRRKIESRWILFFQAHIQKLCFSFVAQSFLSCTLHILAHSLLMGSNIKIIASFICDNKAKQNIRFLQPIVCVF